MIISGEAETKKCIIDLTNKQLKNINTISLISGFKRLKQIYEYKNILWLEKNPSSPRMSKRTHSLGW